MKALGECLDEYIHELEKKLESTLKSSGYLFFSFRYISWNLLFYISECVVVNKKWRPIQYGGKPREVFIRFKPNIGSCITIRGLPLFCKDTPENIGKMVDILVQILGSEEFVERDAVHKALMSSLRQDVKEAKGFLHINWSWYCFLCHSAPASFY